MNRIKKIVRYSVLGLSILLGFVACEDIFNTESTSTINLDNYFESAHDIDNAARGMYDGLQGCVEKMLIWGEIRGDLVDATEKSSWEIKEFDDLAISASNKYTDWSKFYDVINRANLIIKYADRVVEKDFTFKPIEAEQFVAEAVNVRSLCYFWLVRSFGDVPFITEPFDENYNEFKTDTIWDEDGSFSIESMPIFRIDPLDADMILDSLELHLKNVEDIERAYPQETDDGGTRNPMVYSSRFKAISNLALQADIKLWRNKYQEVIDITNKAFDLNHEQYSLGDYQGAPVCYDNSGNPVQRWIDIFAGEGSLAPEVILEIRFQSSTPDLNILQKYTSRDPLEGGAYIIKPTDKVINYWQEDKFWGKRYIDTMDIMRGYNASFTGEFDSISGKWLNPEIFKFIVAGTDGKRRNGFESDANWNLYRMADVLCLYCEAYNRLGYYRASIEKLQGTPYWDTRWSFKPENEGPMGLRKRACVKEYISSNDPSPDLLEAEEIILEERAKELAFEGRRWFDLIRIAKRGQMELFLDEMESSVTEDKKSYIRSQASNPENWFLPYNEEARKNFINPNYKNKAIEKIKAVL